jgi:urate oxidase
MHSEIAKSIFFCSYESSLPWACKGIVTVSEASSNFIRSFCVSSSIDFDLLLVYANGDESLLCLVDFVSNFVRRCIEWEAYSILMAVARDYSWIAMSTTGYASVATIKTVSVTFFAERTLYSDVLAIPLENIRC